MGLTNRIICLSNQAPIELLQTEVDKALSFLRSSRQFNYYFHTYRVYINTLFTARQREEAQQTATDMFEAARQEKQPLGMAMALQVQGSMYYQLNLYTKAMDALEEAYRVCPAYTSEINTLVTHALICEWLCMTALKLEDTGKLTTYADRYHENVEYRNEIRLGDPSGHFPVTAAAFRAQAMLRSGRQEEARVLLDHALTFMRPGIPARAYEHYYEARCEQLYRQADYTGALIAIDTLLNTHQGYFPFYLHDLLRKAEILAHQGKGVESTRLYSRYIAMQDSIERIEIAARMDKLQTLYEVDRLKTEQRNSFLWFLIATSSCTLTLIIFAGYIVYSRRLHRKNRILYQRYLEQEKMEERVLDAIEVLPINSLSKESQLFCQLSELMHEPRRIVAHQRNLSCQRHTHQHRRQEFPRLHHRPETEICLPPTDRKRLFVRFRGWRKVRFQLFIHLLPRLPRAFRHVSNLLPQHLKGKIIVCNHLIVCEFLFWEFNYLFWEFTFKYIVYLHPSLRQKPG